MSESLLLEISHQTTIILDSVADAGMVAGL
jgi:hypothetical protein